MKIALLILTASITLLSGCASTVKTFDSRGNLIGSCESKLGFSGGGASCSGQANQEGKNH